MKHIIIASLLAMSVAPLFADEARPDYPLVTCVVSGETLGDHGDPFIYKYKGREVRFCCKDCIKDFNKDPEAYLKQIDDAKKASTAKDADVELKHTGHDHGKMGHDEKAE